MRSPSFLRNNLSPRSHAIPLSPPLLPRPRPSVPLARNGSAYYKRRLCVLRYSRSLVPTVPSGHVVTLSIYGSPFPNGSRRITSRAPISFSRYVRPGCRSFIWGLRSFVFFDTYSHRFTSVPLRSPCAFFGHLAAPSLFLYFTSRKFLPTFFPSDSFSPGGSFLFVHLPLLCVLPTSSRPFNFLVVPIYPPPPRSRFNKTFLFFFPASPSVGPPDDASLRFSPSSLPCVSHYSSPRLPVWVHFPSSPL